MHRMKQRIISAVAAVALLVSAVPIMTVRAESLSTAVNEPFTNSVTFTPPGCEPTNSDSFRIPSMVTLNDGTIVAAADIRWNSTYDGGGHDTLVARSTNGGVNWDYTVANYLGDNNNQYNGSDSTCFIDPCLTVGADGQTVYMLVDLYPYGIALNGSGNTAPNTNSGFDGDNKLMLSSNSHRSYDYYLNLTDYYIYSSNNNKSTGIKVDSHFNYTETEDGTTHNLFFSDSPYQVARTGFLYLTKSVDGGVTWGAPKLLNLKNSNELVCLVGPGRGITTSNGKIIFPIYGYKGSESTQKTGFIYSTDGDNWTRVDSSLDIWSSESAIVELKNGNLRFFFRNGTSKLRYIDYSFTDGWGGVQDTGIYTNSNTQISAITYSKSSVDSSQVILVSCPASSSSIGSNDSSASARTNGRIFVFTDNGSKMSLANTIQVNNGNFMYSCLTERSDGSVAILYEDTETSWGVGGRYEMEMAAYSASDLGVVFASDPSDEPGDIYDGPVILTDNNVEFTNVASEQITFERNEEFIEDIVAYDVSASTQDGPHTGPATVSIPMPEGWESEKTFGFVLNSDGFLRLIPGDVEDNMFTFRSPHISTVGLLLVADDTQMQEVSINLNMGQTSGPHTVSNTHIGIAGEHTALNGTVSYEVIHQAASGETTVSQLDSLADNQTVVIGSGQQYILLDGSTLGATTDINAATRWTVHAGENGYTLQNGTNYLGFYKNGYGTLSLSVSNTASEWSYSKDGGFHSVLSNTTYYLYYSTFLSAGWNLYNSSSRSHAYLIANSAGTGGSTEVTFSALKPGQDTVQLGSTTYIITVNGLSKTVNKNLSVNTSASLNAVDELGLTEGGYSVSYELTSGTVVSVSSDGTISSGDTAGEASITATVIRDGMVYGTVFYTITVSEVTITDTKNIYIPVGSTSSVEGLTGDIYTGMLDTAIATVVPESGSVNNGTINITGHTVGQTAVVVGTVKFNIFVVNAAARKDSKYLYITVEAMDNCDVYYTINGTGLYPVDGTGVLVEQTYNGGFHLIFFAAPHDGYALMEMSATQQTNNQAQSSMNDFYALSNGARNSDGTLVYPDGSDSAAFPFASADTANNIDCTTLASNSTLWKSGHGFRWSLIEGNLTIEQMRNVFQAALALGCDGATNITKNGTDTFRAYFTFRAVKLPTLSKQIVGYQRAGTPSADDNANGKLTITNYTNYFAFDEDVSFEFGDTLLYKFEVTSYSSNVNYTNIVLKDSMIGYTQNIANNTIDTPGVRNYYATYTITPDDMDLYTGGKFVNSAELDYHYSSLYSTGVYGGIATSEAICDIIGVVSYTWEDGTPEAIVKNEGKQYTLPSSFSLIVGQSFQISPYTGAKTYTETVDGLDVIWTYSEEWGVQKYGVNEKTWFPISSVQNTDFVMEHSRSITFYGRWLASYSVVYNWVGEHPDIPTPAIVRYPANADYTVDNSFKVGDTFNDGDYTWTFHGWKLGTNEEIYNGTTQNIGNSHITYRGSWTKVANATSMTIRKTGSESIDENQSFLFHISGGNVDLDVAIHGNGYVTIDGLTVGETYTVTEMTGWSWRYLPAETQKTIKISSAGNVLIFDNSRSNPTWLNGSSWCDNRFIGTN